MSPTLRDVSPSSSSSLSLVLFILSLAASSIVPMENVTERGRKVLPLPLSLSLSSHLHLGNAAIHNSLVVQFGRFSEYVIAPSYTISFTSPRRFSSLAPSCLFLFLALAALTLRPASRRDDASCRQCIIDITAHRCRPDLNNSPIDR